MNIYVFMQKKEDKKTEGLKKVIIRNGIAMIVLYVDHYLLIKGNLIIRIMIQEAHGKQIRLMPLM